MEGELEKSRKGERKRKEKIGGSSTTKPVPRKEIEDQTLRQFSSSPVLAGLNTGNLLGWNLL